MFINLQRLNVEHLRQAMPQVNVCFCLSTWQIRMVKRFFTMIKRFTKYTSPNERLPYWRVTIQRRDINNG